MTRFRAADAEANSPVVLVFADNSRDPELTEVLRDAQEKIFRQEPRRQPPEMRTQLERGPGADRKYRGHSPREWS